MADVKESAKALSNEKNFLRHNVEQYFRRSERIQLQKRKAPKILPIGNSLYLVAQKIFFGGP
jgi:hypothetical protein